MDTKNTQTTRPIEFHSVDEKPPMMLLSRVYAAGFDDAIVMVGYPPNSLGFKWMQTAYAQGRAAAALGLPPGLGYKMANLEKEPEQCRKEPSRRFAPNMSEAFCVPPRSRRCARCMPRARSTTPR